MKIRTSKNASTRKHRSVIQTNICFRSKMRFSHNEKIEQFLAISTQIVSQAFDRFASTKNSKKPKKDWLTKKVVNASRKQDKTQKIRVPFQQRKT